MIQSCTIQSIVIIFLPLDIFLEPELIIIVFKNQQLPVTQCHYNVFIQHHRSLLNLSSFHDTTKKNREEQNKK